jgi:hypothetical protein
VPLEEAADRVERAVERQRAQLAEAVAQVEAARTLGAAHQPVADAHRRRRSRGAEQPRGLAPRDAGAQVGPHPVAHRRAADRGSVVHVEQQRAHAVLELCRDPALLLREQPGRDVGRRHGVVRAGERHLVEPPVAERGGPVAGVDRGRRPARRAGAGGDRDRARERAGEQHHECRTHRPPLAARGHGAPEPRVRRGGVEHHAEHLAQADEGEQQPGGGRDDGQERARRHDGEQPGGREREPAREAQRPTARHRDGQPREPRAELAHVEPLQQRAPRGGEHHADPAVHAPPPRHPGERHRPEPGQRPLQARRVDQPGDHRLAHGARRPERGAGGDQRRAGGDERVAPVAHRQHAAGHERGAHGEREPRVARRREPEARDDQRGAGRRVPGQVGEPDRHRLRHGARQPGRAGERGPQHDAQVGDREHQRLPGVGEERGVRPPGGGAGDAAERARPDHVLRGGQEERAHGGEVAPLGEHGVGELLGGHGRHARVGEARRRAVGEDVGAEQARGVVQQRARQQAERAEDDADDAERRPVEGHGRGPRRPD